MTLLLDDSADASSLVISNNPLAMHLVEVLEEPIDVLVVPFEGLAIPLRVMWNLLWFMLS